MKIWIHCNAAPQFLVVFMFNYLRLADMTFV